MGLHGAWHQLTYANLCNLRSLESSTTWILSYVAMRKEDLYTVPRPHYKLKEMDIIISGIKAIYQSLGILHSQLELVHLTL